jgi:hypothetical protein
LGPGAVFCGLEHEKSELRAQNWRKQPAQMTGAMAPYTAFTMAQLGLINHELPRWRNDI